MNDLFKSLVSLFKEYGIIKEPEQMVAYEVVFEPDVVDAHGNWMTKETLEKGCENFNENLKKGVVKSNLFHLKETDAFSVVDTWIQKELDVNVAETGQPIKAGSWIAKIQYNDKDLWELKKANVIAGVSIGGKGFINEETGEITDLSFDGELDATDN